MKKLLVYIFLLQGFFSFSQTVCLTGTVLSEQSGALISSALITCGKHSAVSDSVGQFKIKVETRKSVLVKIKHVGYKTTQHKMILRGDTQLLVLLQPDVVNLDEITIQAEKDNSFGIGRLNNIEGTTIFAGKKSEAVYLQDLDANLATNNSRQVFSKIPGINIFENDGSGTTIGVGGRGLNPNRISNFNTRQNGYDISADALGYPESYYTPPTEAIDRIEILRGAAGLQFGTQFGGMINYKFAEAPANKKIAGNFRETGASYGLINSFNQLSGTVKKISYNAFYQYKHYDGWRARSGLNNQNAFGSIKFQANEKLFFKVEYTFFNSLAQQPGGLTDKQFDLDYSTVTRYRNWFRINWNLMAMNADYKLNSRTRISFLAFGLMAGRDALGVLGRVDRADDTSANRNLLSDTYRNFGSELRLLHRYHFLSNSSHFLIGARYYNGHTARLQGDADKTKKASFKFLHPNNLENSEYAFPSSNLALFTENIFQLSRRFSITPGLRAEVIKTSSQGYYRLLNKNLAGDTLLDKKVEDNRNRSRTFLLAGIGAQLRVYKSLELYGNFSQNYRSINFNDMRVLNPNFQVDPELRDERGFTTDYGIRGALKDLLYFDVSVFMVEYQQRIGTTLMVDSSTFQLIRYRTNIGHSTNTGVEAFAELDWVKLASKTSKHKFSTFINTSYIKALYKSQALAYNGKTVEYVPKVIFRTGFTYAFKKLSLSYIYSYTSRQFSDATNAEFSPSAIYGLIPAYSVMDLSAGYSWKYYGINAGVNNLSNAKYFTRRAEGYPGPGILPGDPVNFYLTLRLKF